MATASKPARTSSRVKHVNGRGGDPPGIVRRPRATTGAKPMTGGKPTARAKPGARVKPPTRTRTAPSALKSLASKADGDGAGKLETLTAVWRVGRLAWKIVRGKRPKPKELRKAASSVTEVGAKALSHKAPDASLRPLAELVRRVPADVRKFEQLPEHVRRVPVQVSVDVAVPLEVAYEEWMQFESLPEGAHRVEQIRRRGDRLVGRLNGVGAPREWEAEIRDERRNESFAWLSTRGSDVAGLITFHRLGDRLTRLEMQLDVVPTGVGEAAALALHLADRRAETELRRFKARLETISPDAYRPAAKAGNRSSTKSTKKKKEE
jgi:uncharacterized membrane protein